MSTLAHDALRRSRFAGGIRDLAPMPDQSPRRRTAFSFSAGGERLVLKLFHKPERWRAESRALDLLSSRRVPRVCDRGYSSDVGVGWLVTSFLEGDDRWTEGGDLVADVFVELGREVAAMRACVDAAARSAPADDARVWWQEADEALEKAIGVVAAFDDLGSADLARKVGARYRALSRAIARFVASSATACT